MERKQKEKPTSKAVARVWKDELGNKDTEFGNCEATLENKTEVIGYGGGK